MTENIDKFKNNNFKYRVWGKRGSYLKHAIIKQNGFSKTGGISELSSEITDKDGKYIYENDFIQGESDEFPFLVKFDEGEFEAIEQDGGNDIIEQLSEIAFGCFVVGNVHENPELLETEHA